MTIKSKYWLPALVAYAAAILLFGSNSRCEVWSKEPTTWQNLVGEWP